MKHNVGKMSENTVLYMSCNMFWIDVYAAAETEPNTSLNNAYSSTIRYLNTILLLKDFSVFGHLRTV